MAEELEGAAGEAVRPAARDDVDGGAGLTAVLGREVRRLDLHFLDEVEPDVVDLAAVAARIQVRAAVDEQAARVAARSVDGLTGRAQARRQIQAVVVEQSRAGNDRGELQVVPAVERHVPHLGPVDGPGDFAGGPVHRFAGHRPDFDHFGDAAHIECEVRGETSVRVQDESCPTGFLEPGELRFDGVSARQKIRDHPAALAVSDGGPGCLRAFVGDRHRDTRQPAFGRVGDRADDLSGDGLSGGSRQANQQACRHKRSKTTTPVSGWKHRSSLRLAGFQASTVAALV